MLSKEKKWGTETYTQWVKYSYGNIEKINKQVQEAPILLSTSICIHATLTSRSVKMLHSKK